MCKTLLLRLLAAAGALAATIGTLLLAGALATHEYRQAEVLVAASQPGAAHPLAHAAVGSRGAG